MYPSIKNSKTNFTEQFPVLYQNRFCDQKEFSIAMIGGEIKRKSNGGNKPFLLNNFDSKVYLPTLPVLKLTLSEWDRLDCECKAVSSGSDIYLVADRRKVNCTSRFKKYSSKNISWNSLLNRIEKTFNFCV